jgi:hypothetical protein
MYREVIKNLISTYTYLLGKKPFRKKNLNKYPENQLEKLKTNIMTWMFTQYCVVHVFKYQVQFSPTPEDLKNMKEYVHQERIPYTSRKSRD